MQDECNLFHVHNWIQFFVSIYNNVTTTKDNSSKNRNSDKETIDKTDIKVEEKNFDYGGGFFFSLLK